jgi:hypothetical protein
MTLEQRAVGLEHGQSRAEPSQMGGGVGRVLTYSHLANWLCSQAMRWAVGEAGTAMPYVVRPGRRVPSENLENLRHRLYVWVLNAPEGIRLCEAPIEPGSECDWLAKDMKLIAAVLRAAEVSWVDNRSRFDAASTEADDPLELGWHERQARLPVHLSAQGRPDFRRGPECLV